MEKIKHECGIALIRLRKPLSFYKKKYGTYSWALQKLYLLMEKQHNRGQEAAGIGVVKLNTQPGLEYVFRERALGKDAIQNIFDKILPDLIKNEIDKLPPRKVEEESPFVGEIYMGHLRYSTTGKSGMNYVHPFLRRNNWRSRNLLLCGNFNMTNVDEIFHQVISQGQHPRIYSDTVILLEQLGYALDKENHRVYKRFRQDCEGIQLTQKIEDNIDLSTILKASAPLWDGGFVICGATGSGDIFALRDSHGIRPAYYYIDDEIIVVASERPVIQTVFNVARKEIIELPPGNALIVSKEGKLSIEKILMSDQAAKCSFERIYFSRGSDAEIYNERKRLGENLVPDILERIGYNLKDSVFSYIPNTAEVSFLGMIEGLENHLNQMKRQKILNLSYNGSLNPESLKEIMSTKLRIDKIAIKDIKLRTFISEGGERNELASHVYDVTYGCVRNNQDNLILIDDSIVRGTTLSKSILRILDRLHPKKIIIVSSAPIVKYPDCYGIDMSSLHEFAAFRAAVELLKENGKEDILTQVYNHCKKIEATQDNSLINCVKKVYSNFSDKEISKKMVEMLRPKDINAEVELIFQSLEGLHKAIPEHSGDWYFSGNYPTPGGYKFVNKAFIDYYENNL